MIKSLRLIFLIAAVAVFLPALALAQEEGRAVSAGGSRYVISAEAGGVNYVEGRVTVSRGNQTSGYLLKGDSVSVGDVIETSADGRAEILLNPGSYARLGSDSNFEFLDTSLEDLELKLNRGVAIFEVITTDDFSFVIRTPKASFNIVRSGIYRVDVLADGKGQIEVWKGRALIGSDSDARVKKGRTATVDGGQVAIVKFDRDDRDDLEEWSRDRSKEISKINSRLEREKLRDSLISSFYRNRWNLYDSFGVWVYDPTWRSFVFLPFGSRWYSPYGYLYRRDLWYCRLPRRIYRQPPPRRGNATQNRNRISRDKPAQGPGISRDRRERRNVPPFRKLNRRSDTPPSERRSAPVRISPRVIVPRSSKSSPSLQKRGKPE